MQVTPNQSFEQLRESLAQYLETQYRLSSTSLRRQRGEMLRAPGSIAQTPFIESTPSFVTSRRLAAVEAQYSQLIPKGLAELVAFGVPVDKNDLYEHQEKALVAAHSAFAPNLLVATGTGSGKTEAFLLPILSDILREARAWKEPKPSGSSGFYDEKAGVWQHSRRHEMRRAGIRAIVLYPMNALVNDQLSRLRRMLALGGSAEWQARHLNKNRIHFGMYTSGTPRAGLPSDLWRRNAVEEYLSDVDKQWQRLTPKLRNTGNWAHLDTPEMLLRWDMQAAPPDILVTNYSMLEYMLVRPIESGMFNLTRDWLSATPGSRFTLVLDEAHTYTGAKGTEVAHLIRRLKERLGIGDKPSAFRAIATTASVPSGEDEKLKSFASVLFGEPAERFSLIRSPQPKAPASPHNPSENALKLWASFHDQFSIVDPKPALDALANELGQPPCSVDETLEQAAFRLAQGDLDLGWLRHRTARNATPLDKAAEDSWGALGDRELRRKATAGLLAIGSFARKDSSAASLPLLSMRLHSFFRGISGLWACLDPKCSQVLSKGDQHRPVGNLYLEPRPWCPCGARVLELFTCRYCGLASLAGIPDSEGASLWPWNDDLSGPINASTSYRIFGVERPDTHSKQWTSPSYRSTRTTELCDASDEHARETWEVIDKVGSEDGIKPENHFPKQCPRCCRYRNTETGREVVENLQTKGVQSFAALLEEAFREQPRSSTLIPNYGRKALVFSDSRSQAARLAQDLKDNHASDLFRQLLVKLLYQCEICDGRGSYIKKTGFTFAKPGQKTIPATCDTCGGSGMAPHPESKSYASLKTKLRTLQESRGIDPTRQRVSQFFQKSAEFDAPTLEVASRFTDLALRREITDEQFALEPLGLGIWQVPLLQNGEEILVTDDAAGFPNLTAKESNILFQSTIRLLAIMNVVLAPNPNHPWDWGKSPQGGGDLLDVYRRNVVLRGGYDLKLGFKGKAIGFSFREDYKLGRYIAAVARKLVRLGRLESGQEEQWSKSIFDVLWDALVEADVLTMAGQKITRYNKTQVPYGIRLDRFRLHPAPEHFHRCDACGYVMADPLLETCFRCGHDTTPFVATEVSNYFRKIALLALPASKRDDPFPLKASEHTAQVSSSEARNEERWFQDLFLDGQSEFDRRVDILSVTTTMEMGIDIGSLLCVGLRNVPPTVANYQQRAGRAGRRGSALASVITFASTRSHDAYYFDRPPEIVSDPPRVPALHFANPIIARRHVRSLILQEFFAGRAQVVSNLFASWGAISDLLADGTIKALTTFIEKNHAGLLTRGVQITAAELHSELPQWIADLPAEVESFIVSNNLDTLVLDGLISHGLLPKYAFPVDVVSLTIPAPESSYDDGEDETEVDTLQRDLKIAIAEYAPGAEVVRQSQQVTWKYRSVGLHDPFNVNPAFSGTDTVLECQKCKAVKLVDALDEVPTSCSVCGEAALNIRRAIQPKGFTVDGAVLDGGREIYESSGGIDSGGSATPVRLHVGTSTFASGTSMKHFSGRLLTDVRAGRLLVTNNGPEGKGFVLCPTCGREVDPEDTTPHRRPVSVPPLYGPKRGPKAGSICPAKGPWTNELILVHSFHSEVLLLGVDLPKDLNASFVTHSGQSIWNSFGTLIANAATKVLQIDPGELRAGVRPVRKDDDRLHAEVFLYDDVPGGAGYARRLKDNLVPIFTLAAQLGAKCANPLCESGCYRCIFDYRNQGAHSKLDRPYGTDLLQFVLNDLRPTMNVDRLKLGLAAVREYARGRYEILPGYPTPYGDVPMVLTNQKNKIALWPIHPLAAMPSPEQRGQIKAASGDKEVRLAVHDLFDMERRPFWIVDQLSKAE